LLRSLQNPVQVRGLWICFVSRFGFMWVVLNTWERPTRYTFSSLIYSNLYYGSRFGECRVVITSPNPQDGGPSIVGRPPLVMQYIRSYPAYWKPFFHPQPEEAPFLDWQGTNFHGYNSFSFYRYQKVIATNTMSQTNINSSWRQDTLWSYVASLQIHFIWRGWKNHCQIQAFLLQLNVLTKCPNLSTGTSINHCM
jgi:hypothetical protein